MAPIVCNVILLANADYLLTDETHIWHGFQSLNRNIRLGNLTTHFMSSFNLIQKGKIFPVQAMKAYMGRRVTTPLILNLGTRWMWVVNFTPWPLYPRSHWPEGWVSSRASQDISCPTRIWTQAIQPTASHYTCYTAPASSKLPSHHRKSNRPNAACGMPVWHDCCTCYNHSLLAQVLILAIYAVI
jgi:hypothetical protein